MFNLPKVGTKYITILVLLCIIDEFVYITLPLFETSVENGRLAIHLSDHIVINSVSGMFLHKKDCRGNDGGKAGFVLNIVGCNLGIHLTLLGGNVFGLHIVERNGQDIVFTFGALAAVIHMAE